MSETYFIADLHYGHNGIHEKFRTNFQSEEDHDKTIHENILSVSSKRNDLWILGDIVFKTDKFHMIGEYASRFRNVHLVLGNHDHKAFAKYASDNNMHVYGLTKKFGFWLSHCPIHPQEMYRANGNIHGHLHSSKVMKTFHPAYDVRQEVDPKYVCVSCEHVNNKPITLMEIRRIFGEV